MKTSQHTNVPKHTGRETLPWYNKIYYFVLFVSNLFRRMKMYIFYLLKLFFPHEKLDVYTFDVCYI